MEILEIRLSDLSPEATEKLFITLDEMGVKYSKEEVETIEEYNKSLDEAEAAIERGKYVTMEQLIEEAKNW